MAGNAVGEKQFLGSAMRCALEEKEKYFDRALFFAFASSVSACPKPSLPFTGNERHSRRARVGGVGDVGSSWMTDEQSAECGLSKNIFKTDVFLHTRHGGNTLIR
jgi:hypothetical protein